MNRALGFQNRGFCAIMYMSKGKRNGRTREMARKIWENIQYLGLALTIVGQIVIGPWWLLGQSLWEVANLISVSRDFALHRPTADKVKDICMTALTTGLIAASFIL